jgi:hypothetical protein
LHHAEKVRLVGLGLSGINLVKSCKLSGALRLRKKVDGLLRWLLVIHQLAA